MKQEADYQKLRGGYYTPETVAKFIVDWAVKDANIHSVLEPSCGDGNFLKALKATGYEGDVIGIELDPNEAEKAKSVSPQYNIINDDFFTYYEKNINNKTHFDLILGNPPFIRYQNFDEDYRDKAIALMKEHGFKPTKLMNIWLPFLLLSCEALTEDGKIGMVIPAELFQVNYAKEARIYLSRYFDWLRIITFRELVFNGIQQEIVLILGEKKSNKKGINVSEYNNFDELIDRGNNWINDGELKETDLSGEKWLKYFLTNEELKLLDRLGRDERISNAEELYTVNVGLVSGENSFFNLSYDDVKKYRLEEFVEPIICRADQLKGIVLTHEDFNSVSDTGKRVWMFSPRDEEYDDLTVNERKYIDYGVSKGYDKNYKCRIRKRWYYFPKTWKPEAFAIRQANLYPRLIYNAADTYVTDTLHKIRFKQGIKGTNVVAAFVNTYTLALSETLGRSYGGGVLTFEPSEMQRMRIPMKNADKLDFILLDRLQREGEVNKVLAYTDDILLRQGLGLTQHEIDLLHDIWNRLRNRRISRKRVAAT